MKVRVKTGKKGFIYGILRHEGQEFVLKDDKKFSENWMEEVNPKKKETKKEVKKDK